jgi:VanZ family protein
MNWNRDSDHNMSVVTYGFSSVSAAFIPRSTARSIWRFFLAVLIIAGLLGASFEVMQCYYVISRVVHNDSHAHSAEHHHATRKDR